MTELVLKEEVYQIIGAAMDVYYTLGRGFLEPVYQEALGVEFQRRNIPFQPKLPLTIFYKGEPLKQEYIPDFVCYGQIVAELKALDHLSGNEVAQLINYLAVTRDRVGLLINFGSNPKLEWKRYVF
jgi:GxxExxY protein